MAFNIDKKNSVAGDLCSVIIDEDMTIYAIESLKQAFTKMFDGYHCFELNLSDVEEIDSSGIQLLLALKSELALRHKTFVLTAISNDVEKLLDAYGIKNSFVIGEAA